MRRAFQRSVRCRINQRTRCAAHLQMTSGGFGYICSVTPSGGFRRHAINQRARRTISSHYKIAYHGTLIGAPLNAACISTLFALLNQSAQEACSPLLDDINDALAPSAPSCYLGGCRNAINQPHGMRHSVEPVIWSLKDRRSTTHTTGSMSARTTQPFAG